MDRNSVRRLVNSISRFIHLVSCHNLKPIPSRKDYFKIVSLLKLLKPLLDEAADYKISCVEVLYKECEELDVAVNEAREFVEGWCPKFSKISCFLRSEQLLMRIRSSFLKICCALETLLNSSSTALSLSAVQHCVQEQKYLELESTLIEEALRVQSKGSIPCNDHLLKIVKLLGLTTSNELLEENIALEEEKMKAEVNKKKEECDNINKVIELLYNIRSCMVNVGHLKSIYGLSIPPYFCCPLSLELMVDPVIVASGQTFERVSIQKWLDHGLSVCPKTRQILSHRNLIPNYTVKALIANWCDENNLRFSDVSECSNTVSVPHLNNQSFQNSIHSDSFCSSHSNYPSGTFRESGRGNAVSRFGDEVADACKGKDTLKFHVSAQKCKAENFVSLHSNSSARFFKEVGDRLEKQRTNATFRLEKEIPDTDNGRDVEKVQTSFQNFISFCSSHSNSPSESPSEIESGLEKQRVASSRFDEELCNVHKHADTGKFHKSFQELMHMDSYCSCHSNSPSRSSTEVENGTDKQRAKASSRSGEERAEIHKGKDAETFHKSLEKFIHTDSSYSPRTNFPLISPAEVGIGLDKQRVDASYSFDEERVHVNRARDAEKVDASSPQQSYICSRTGSAASAISSFGYVPDSVAEVSRISAKNDYMSEVSGEITSERATSLNKDGETAHVKRARDAEKVDPSSPEQSSIPSRGGSAASAISSIGYVPAAFDEVSRISDKNDNGSEVSGEITSERATFPNKDVECSPRLSGRQFKASQPRTEMATNGSSDEQRNLSLSFAESDDLTTSYVYRLVDDLKSRSEEVQTRAAAEIRLLAKHKMENRITIGHCGAISPLLSLLYSEVKETQEHAVTALLNLSICEDNKAMIAEAGAIEPLIHVLKSGNAEAKENSAAALFSLSVLEGYKAKIGRSGAIKALVDLLSSGTLRGKKDAATALFNLSIFHENKARIVQAGTVKQLVEMMDPVTGMVDKAVALLANLSTISEGRSAIAREGGIPMLVEIVESGSQRGKENAASVLLQLCLNNTKYCALVLQEGAVPPLVALSQSGTARAKEKAQQLLSHFRSQREGSSLKRK